MEVKSENEADMVNEKFDIMSAKPNRRAHSSYSQRHMYGYGMGLLQTTLGYQLMTTTTPSMK